MILICRTYTECTPESSEDGEASDAGFIATDESVGFRELVKLMREHGNPSCSPARGETFEWYSTEFETTDYRTATERSEALHFSHHNTPHAARYWRLAAIAAGHVK